ncbi:uncharacterized protein A4U43_C01F13380 [Asparagus officinalis]|uniref:Uncharacterized protein n=1 Tax=Asparagus officinalis TaxID=4686 RepID=A0A5P1FST5_ASPOF|nr:omega-hydroxypalmitate O-feruloyl transferase-like [Asparagus officinalis]ONK80059.1 uncharacterized protein A4U43_C01F13380 [Asparagus officinalis]
MVAVDQSPANLTVKFISETVVRATNHSKNPMSIFPISNLDRIMGGIPIIIFYVYNKPLSGHFSSVLNAVKLPLSQALDHFPLFAGEISQDSSGEPEVLCNNKGVRLIEASTNISLFKLDFYEQNNSIQKIILKFDNKYPLSVQITSYTCGGFSISWCFDHLLADASGFIKFLSVWCEIAQTKKLLPSMEFNNERHFLRPRTPLMCSERIDRIFTVCNTGDAFKMPEGCATERHLYLVKSSTLEKLKQEASSKYGPNRTRTEALSAYLWKMMARTFDKYCKYTRCKMGWAVDGRKWMTDEESISILNFTGNVCSMAVGNAAIEELIEKSLAHIASTVSNAINEVANREHFLDLIDWIECHRTEKIVPKLMLSDCSPAILVSSCCNMPVMGMDFGFGLPALGMFCSALDRLSAGYVNIVSSGRDDNSWFVSAFIWPELARELELDANHVFEPISVGYVGV